MEVELKAVKVEGDNKGKEKRRSKRSPENRDESDEFAIPAIIPTDAQRTLKVSS